MFIPVILEIVITSETLKKSAVIAATLSPLGNMGLSGSPTSLNSPMSRSMITGAIRFLPMW